MYAHINCGYTRLSFMNKEFAPQYNFHHYQLKTPKTIDVINGHLTSSSNITEYVHTECTIGNCHEYLVAYIASRGHYPLVLRIPWLKKYNRNINFAKMDI
jgi:hypothetical protein